MGKLRRDGDELKRLGAIVRRAGRSDAALRLPLHVAIARRRDLHAANNVKFAGSVAAGGAAELNEFNQYGYAKIGPEFEQSEIAKVLEMVASMTPAELQKPGKKVA